MSAQFTPGPWDVFDDDSYMVFAYVDGTATIIADADPVNQRTSQSDDECMANALLIAKAPDMLALLKDCEESFTADGSYALLRDACRKLIAEIDQ